MKSKKIEIITKSDWQLDFPKACKANEGLTYKIFTKEGTKIYKCVRIGKRKWQWFCIENTTRGEV